MAESCRTRYPIVLVHGAGFRDLKWPLYWGRIPQALEARGAELHYGLQDSWGQVADNARTLSGRIIEICQQSGCDKVNIIAHSKGGLEARMAASSLGLGERIASITTVATPHHGSRSIDKLLRLPPLLFRWAAFVVDNWVRLLGDKKPDFLRVCQGFSTAAMVEFNAANPDHPGVFYQSYAGVMSSPFADINLSTANLIVNLIEGENDGLVSAESARWGQRFTILRGAPGAPARHKAKRRAGWGLAAGRRGVSHLDEVDFRRSSLSRYPGAGVRDICEVYVDIVRGLKERGF